MGDYHLHLWEHRDSDDDPAPADFSLARFEAYVEAAAARGVTELGFTEHLYRFVESGPVLGEFWRHERRDLAEHTESFVRLDRIFRLEDYVEGVIAAKEAGLPVRLGLEIDFFPHTIDGVLDLIAPYPWDFLIGSVHWVGGWAIDGPRAGEEMVRRGVRRAWEEYFELETALAASGTVDVLAHVDVCKKAGVRPAEEPLDLYREVVKAATASGTAVEVSSQGLRKPAAEVYPAPRFLEEFCSAGVPITLASDAHAPGEAAWGYDEVRTAARAAGYRTRLAFEGRARIEVPL